MKVHKLSNGWTAISRCIDINTKEEIELTDEVKNKLIDQMLLAAGYKRNLNKQAI